ncbi:histidine phosphatase family protein [Candidatus Woesearchaeota archaeon]|nr:histidine phosphatase family protein [Candidatus Woesearchaeota archaeon]
MRLILVRHGETDDNVNHISQGHRDTGLNERGRLQSAAIGRALRAEKVDAIFSSDLRRARETAEAILRFHNAPVTFSRHIREQSIGVFEGRPREDFKSFLLESAAKGMAVEDVTPGAGESMRDVRRRAEDFISILAEKYKGRTVLVVTHGGFLRMLLGVLLNRSAAESMTLFKLKNACINIIEVSPAGSKAHVINSVSHLGCQD